VIAIFSIHWFNGAGRKISVPMGIAEAVMREGYD
jgi:hypothetical protein